MCIRDRVDPAARECERKQPHRDQRIHHPLDGNAREGRRERHAAQPRHRAHAHDLAGADPGLLIDANDAVTLVGLTTSQGLAPAGFGADDGLSALIVRLVRAADTPGLYVPSSGAWFPRFVNASGPANLVFTYGAGGSGLVHGDPQRHQRRRHRHGTAGDRGG